MADDKQTKNSAHWGCWPWPFVMKCTERRSIRSAYHTAINIKLDYIVIIHYYRYYQLVNNMELYKIVHLTI